MVVKWRPDTCNCLIVFNQDTKTVIEDKCEVCPRHKHLKGDNILIENENENRSINTVYVGWLESEIKDNIDAILEYKALWKQQKITIPLRQQPPTFLKTFNSAKRG